MTQEIENRRRELQRALDVEKSQHQRNQLGQFSTPPGLAAEILQYATTLLPPGTDVRFLDPAFGTGAFYSALLKSFPRQQLKETLGFEIDPYYGLPTRGLWESTSLDLRITDFTRAAPSPRFNLVICNPPYVRHHHLSRIEKQHLRTVTQQASGMKLSGLAGLYCHFLGLAHPWMAADGLAGWLIPSEFLDVNYGQEVKQYLTRRVTLLRIHCFAPVDRQFGDALVTSAVVWLRNTSPRANHSVTLTYGGTLLCPADSRVVSVETLKREGKWSRFFRAELSAPQAGPVLADLFEIRRGLATGDNSYFILPERELEQRGLPRDVFTPILPGPRHLPVDEVAARGDGTPDIPRRLFLLDLRHAEAEVRAKWPMLSQYLDEGQARGVCERYLCRHRAPWYRQERRLPAPLICTYLGRRRGGGRPFRFILNESRATVANVYLAMTPKGRLAEAIEADSTLLRRIWQRLNQLTPEELIGAGRVYGGGLHKLEPRELGRVDARFLNEIIR